MQEKKKKSFWKYLNTPFWTPLGALAFYSWGVFVGKDEWWKWIFFVICFISMAIRFYYNTKD